MNAASHFGELNIIAGWIFMFMGIFTGSIIGLWSFNGPVPTPPGHHNYTDLPRRLNRLAHIACFALPIICILYGERIDSIPLSLTARAWGSYSMIVCMIGIPLFLFLASIRLPFKYFEVIPVSAGLIAFGIMAWGHIQIAF